MSRLARPRVVFFDWHGTLADTFKAMYLAVDDTLMLIDQLRLAARIVSPRADLVPAHEALVGHVREFHRLPQCIKDEHRVSRTEIFEILFGVDEEAKRIAHEAFDLCYMRHFGEVRPAEPRVRATLAALRSTGVRTGLLSNRRRPLLMRELRRVDGTGWVDLFDVVVCGDDVARRKPAPDMVERGLAALGIAPGAEVWFVGDSTTDTIAAKEAGVASIYYNGAKWAPDDLVRIFPGSHRPDVIAGDFAALEELALPPPTRSAEARRRLAPAPVAPLVVALGQPSLQGPVVS